MPILTDENTELEAALNHISFRALESKSCMSDGGPASEN
jgi:hypothetical protein